MKIKFWILAILNPILFSTPGPWGFPQAVAQSPRPCGEIPSDIVIMLDRTASVSPENRWKEAEAAENLVELLLNNSKNQIALGRFGAGDCETSYQNYLRGIDWTDAEILQELSNDPDLIKTKLHQGMGEESCGGTDLHDAVNVAIHELNFGSNPEGVLILISDGDPNQPSDLDTARSMSLETALEAKEAGIRIFTIAFDANGQEDISNRQRLAAMASNQSQDNSTGSIEPEEQEMENNDGDDFFIAPTGDDLERVFLNIGEVLLCDDGDPCTTDTCNPSGQCEYQVQGRCKSETAPIEPPPNPIPADSLEPNNENNSQETPPLFFFGGGMGCSLSSKTSSPETPGKSLIWSLLLGLPGFFLLWGSSSGPLNHRSRIPEPGLPGLWNPSGR